MSLGAKLISIIAKIFTLSNIIKGISFAVLASGLIMLIDGIERFKNADMGTWQKIITIFISLAAIGAAAVALHLLGGNWVAAIGIAAVLVGLA